jgi:hypothetical protein
MNGEQALFFILSVWVTLMALGLAFDAAGAFLRARQAFIRARQPHRCPTPEREASHFPPQAQEWER